MKKTLLLAAVALVSLAAAAEDKVEGTVGADVVSRYIWRGQDLGDAAVQPTAGLSYKGLSLTGWGSYGFLDQDDAREFDITLAIAAGGFNAGITDYYFSYAGEDNPYFEYRNGHSTHVWEANVGYDFGCFSAQWYTNFAGADGENKSGKRAYSSYFELAAPFKLATCDWTASLGIVPYATSFYADCNGFAVSNISLRATKTIPVTRNWGIPVFAQAVANPSTKKGYLVVGFTVAP